MDGFREDLDLIMAGKTPKPRKPEIPVTANPFDDLILESSNKYGVDPDLIRAQMGQESQFKPRATSYKGASGLMQLMPATAQRFGVTDIYDPKQNIDAGVKYMKWLLDRFDGDVDLALAGYNAGEGAVDKYGRKIPPYKETQDYVSKIRAKYNGAGYLNGQKIADSGFADFTKGLDEIVAPKTESLASFQQGLDGITGQVPSKALTTPQNPSQIQPIQTTPNVMPIATVTPQDRQRLETERAAIKRRLDTGLGGNQRLINKQQTRLIEIEAKLGKPQSVPNVVTPNIVTPTVETVAQPTIPSPQIETLGDYPEIAGINPSSPTPLTLENLAPAPDTPERPALTDADYQEYLAEFPKFAKKGETPLSREELNAKLAEADKNKFGSDTSPVSFQAMQDKQAAETQQVATPQPIQQTQRQIPQQQQTPQTVTQSPTAQTPESYADQTLNLRFDGKTKDEFDKFTRQETERVLLSKVPGATGADVDAALGDSKLTSRFDPANPVSEITIPANLQRAVAEERDKRVATKKATIANLIASGTDLQSLPYGENSDNLDLRGISMTDVLDAYQSPEMRAAKEKRDVVSQATNEIERINALLATGQIDNLEAFDRIAAERKAREALEKQLTDRIDAGTEVPGVMDASGNRTKNVDEFLRNEGLFSAKDFLEKQERERKENIEMWRRIAANPNSAATEFTKNLVRTVPKAISGLFKGISIADETLETLFYDTNAADAKDRWGYKFGQWLDKKTDEFLPQDRQLKNSFILTTIPDAVGQLILQVAAGAATGGAALPLLLGVTSGASEAYDEADRFRGTKNQKLLAALVGGIASAPDILPIAKWIKPLTATEKAGFFTKLVNKLFSEVREEEATTLARQFIKNSIKGGLFEGAQEVSENKINDALASMTFDKKRKIFTINGRDLESFFAGFIGGSAGGSIQTTLENNYELDNPTTRISPDQIAQSLDDSQNGVEKAKNEPKSIVVAPITDKIKEEAERKIAELEKPESPITRRQQVNSLTELGFSNKEIDTISTTDAAEIVENKYTPQEWNNLVESEKNLPDLKLEEALNKPVQVASQNVQAEPQKSAQTPANTQQTDVQVNEIPEQAASLESENVLPKPETVKTETEVATVSHPNPDIDGKPIIATTGDGKAVVINENNKSGISVVKQSVAPTVKTEGNKITVSSGESVRAFTNTPKGKRRAERYAKQLEVEQKFETLKKQPNSPAYSLAKANSLTDDLIKVVENDFTGADLKKARIYPDGRMNEQAFRLMSMAHKEAFNQSETPLFHGVYLNPTDLGKVSKAFKEILDNSSPENSGTAQKLYKQFEATITPFGDAIHVVTSQSAPNGLKTAWEEETAHAQDYRVGEKSSLSVQIFPKDAIGRKAIKAIAKTYKGKSSAYLAREVGAKIWKSNAAEELNLSEDELTHLQRLQYNSFLDAGVTADEFDAAVDEVVKAGKYYEELEKASNSGNQENSGESDGRRSGSDEGKVSAVREGEADPAYSIGKFLDETKSDVKPDDPNVAEAVEPLARDDVFTTITNLRRAGLLTGVRTHLKNVSSNAVFQGTEEISKAFGYFADVFAATKTGQRTISFVDPAAVAKSFKAVVKADNVTKQSGIARAKEILLYGDTKENLEKQQLKQANTGLKALDWYVNGVFRTLGAEDAIFKTYAFRRSLEEQAKVLAITAKKQDPSINAKEYRDNLLQNPDAYMIAEADLYADFATFQNKNPLAKTVTDATAWLKDKGFWGKAGALAVETAIPFTNTPSNVLARVLDYSPVGFIKTGKNYKNLVTNSSDAKTQADAKTDTRRARFDEKLTKLRQREDARADAKIQNFSDALSAVQEKIKLAKDKPAILEKLQQKETDLAEAIQKAKLDKQAVQEKRKFSDLDETEQRKAIDEITEKLFTRKEQQEFASNFGRASLGTSMMALGFLLAQSGFLAGVWGFDSEDREKNAEFMKRRKQGIENGSLLIPGVGRIVILDSPLGKSLTLGATLYEQMQTKPKKGEKLKVLGDIKDSLWTIATEQPLIKTGEDYLGAKKSIDERAGGLLGSFVPTILSDVGEVLDEKPRKAKGFVNPIIRRIPVLRERADESTTGVSKEERGGILRRAVRAVDPFNTRSPKKYKYGR